jgi:hypothetical protein
MVRSELTHSWCKGSFLLLVLALKTDFYAVTDMKVCSSFTSWQMSVHDCCIDSWYVTLHQK